MSLEELLQYPIIGLSQDSDTFRLYESFFAEYGLELKINLETATMGQVRDFVIGNLGIGCASPDYLQPVIDEGKVVKV